MNKRWVIGGVVVAALATGGAVAVMARKGASSGDAKPEDKVLDFTPKEVVLPRSQPLAGMVDLAEERNRLEKELREARSHIERLEKLLAGDFAAKAPPALVQKEREKLESHRKTAEKIAAQLR